MLVRNLKAQEWRILLTPMPIAITNIALRHGPGDGCLDGQSMIAIKKQHIFNCNVI